jgi:hypothetical protein
MGVCGRDSDTGDGGDGGEDDDDDDVRCDRGRLPLLALLLRPREQWEGAVRGRRGVIVVVVGYWF